MSNVLEAPAGPRNPARPAASSAAGSPAMIRFVCGTCHKRLSVPTKYAGRKGICPRCKTVNRVPQAGDAPARQTLPPPQPVARVAPTQPVVIPEPPKRVVAPKPAPKLDEAPPLVESRSIFDDDAPPLVEAPPARRVKAAPPPPEPAPADATAPTVWPARSKPAPVYDDGPSFAWLRPVWDWFRPLLTSEDPDVPRNPRLQALDALDGKGMPTAFKVAALLAVVAVLAGAVWGVFYLVLRTAM